MPVKRRKAKDRLFTITQEILELWKTVAALRAQDRAAGGVWEDEGGCHRAFLDAGRALHTALGRHPWQWFVEESIGDRPGWYVDDQKLADFREAAALRLTLIGASKPGRKGTP